MARWARSTARGALLAALCWAGTSSAEAKLLDNDCGPPPKLPGPAPCRAVPAPPGESFGLVNGATAVGLGALLLLGLGALAYGRRRVGREVARSGPRRTRPYPRAVRGQRHAALAGGTSGQDRRNAMSEELAPPRAQVRRQDRAVTDEGWIRELLKRAPYGTLATVRDGQPFVNMNIF